MVPGVSPNLPPGNEVVLLLFSSITRNGPYYKSGPPAVTRRAAVAPLTTLVPTQQAQDPRGQSCMSVPGHQQVSGMANGPGNIDRKALFSGLGGGEAAERGLCGALLWCKVKAFFQSK